jgi:hypothetical protein
MSLIYAGAMLLDSAFNIFEETLRGIDKDMVTPEDKKSLYTFVLV